MAERFAATCGLGREASEYFVVLVAFTQATTSEERAECYQRLTRFRRYRRAQKLELAEAAYHSTWYLPAIRELCLSTHFQDDPDWIAGALQPPIKPAEAKQALETLLELGLLHRDESGTLRVKSRVVSTGAETIGMHIRNYHEEMMARAVAAMELVPAAERDISSLTLCVDAAGLSRLKERLADLRRELVELCESRASANRVVQINLQLFPLTRDISLPDGRTKRTNKPRSNTTSSKGTGR
jgi:uncharacterized protein (TIGR02147 family)